MKRKDKSPKGDWQSQDRDFASEQNRYEDPVPSRSLILETLNEHAGPLNVDELIGHFSLTKLNQQSALEKRLAAMVRDGQLVQNRNGAYGPVTQMNVIPGVIQAHRDGFGFLIRDEGGPDVFLPPRQMRSLMNGDRALVRITGTDFKGRPEGALVEVLERGSREIVGRLHVEQGLAYVIPDNPRVQQDVLIPPEVRGGAQHGQMVVAEITAPPGNRTLPVGKVIEILGDHLAPGMEIEAAIRAHSLPFEFPHDVEAQAENIPDTVQPHQIKGREDLRDLPLMTIDGSDARDFDDAVFAKRVKAGLLTKGGWTLWVAIADVAAYVTPGSPLDDEASKRGTSVYFPQRVIPMLPEKLSNGLCSLNPDVDRLCMVCEMRVTPDGEVTKARFYEGVMRSKARLIYEDVAAVLGDTTVGDVKKVPEHAVPHLHVLNEVFDALYKAREKRGAIDFDTVETRIVFGEDRKIDRIVPIKRNRAHRLIEECMVAANVEAAKRVAKAKIPSPYRVHEKPDAMKVQVLKEFLTERGLKLTNSDRPETQDYAKLMQRAKGRPDQNLIQTIMLRSLMQARYSAENLGHFGLALTHYAHFTSPIRRYPDLMLHRALKHLIYKQAPKKFAFTTESVEKSSAHCSLAERRADEATRDVTTWLKCEYMSHHVGEEHDGIVSGVAPFGLFIELAGLYVEGLVHVSNLKNDYYQYEARHHRLIGERSGQAYGLGEPVKVKVVRVNLDERKIDLELVQSGNNGQSQGRPRPQHTNRSSPVQEARPESRRKKRPRRVK